MPELFGQQHEVLSRRYPRESPRGGGQAYSGQAHAGFARLGRPCRQERLNERLAGGKKSDVFDDVLDQHLEFRSRLSAFIQQLFIEVINVRRWDYLAVFAPLCN